MFDALQIRRVNEGDLSLVLAWRNHADVRHYMFTQHEISLDEHLNWYDKVSQDKNRHLLIVEEDSQAIGYVQFSKVDEGGIAEWGFFARPDAPKGLGRKLGVAALNYAFGPLKLHKVCGQAFECNKASIGFHLMLGFTLEGVLRDHHRINSDYHNLHCFGLLSMEWQPKIVEEE
jgi:UDP-4-amino-4,6-dideoxy-N-acetyl-beta-L-altrosamine N-acetyltransferase